VTQPTTLGPLEDILTFPFLGKDWQNKLLVGSLIVLASFAVPIVPLFLVYGYGIHAMRQIIETGDKPHLPEWEDWSALFVDGAKLFAVGLVYALPLLVLGFLGGGFFMAGSVVPAIIAESMTGESAPAVAGISALAGMAAGFVMTGLTTILGLAMGAFLPAAIGHVVATGEFGAAFRVREWWSVFRANLGGYVLIMAVMFGLSMALSVVVQVLFFTGCLCCLVPVLMAPATLYLTLVTYSLYGRAYYVGTERLAAQAD
jgi:hypothetical protein